MIFDFDKFKRIVSRLHEDDTDTFTQSETLAVFENYFRCYEEYQGVAHPPIRIEHVINIMHNMPYMPFVDGKILDLYPEDYPALIERHFKTVYRRCDYNINHFFSGKIRAMRYIEVCI